MVAFCHAHASLILPLPTFTETCPCPPACLYAGSRSAKRERRRSSIISSSANGGQEGETATATLHVGGPAQAAGGCRGHEVRVFGCSVCVCVFLREARQGLDIDLSLPPSLPPSPPLGGLGHRPGGKGKGCVGASSCCWRPRYGAVGE